MASIGLRVNDSGVGANLGLGDVLSKAMFGDPEAAAKAQLMASQMRAHEAYAAKLAADTGLVGVKTKEEQDLLDAQRGSGASTGEAMAAAVPAPVPVEAPRPDAGAFGNVGPQPGIVTPEAQHLHDASVTALRNLGPVIVRSGNSSQIVDALGKGTGYGGLVGGLESGARADPAKLRVAGGLYTGTAPSASTVWSPGDTAGVNAAANADAGKQIAIETAKSALPQLKDVPGVGIVQIQNGQATPVQGAQSPAFGTTDKGLQQTVYTNLKAKQAAGQPLTPLEQAQFDQAAAAVTKDNQIAPIKGSKGETLYRPDPNDPNKVIPLGGQVQPAEEPGAFAGQNSIEGVSAKVVSNTSVKMQDAGYKPSPQEAIDYATSYNHLYGPKQNYEKDAQGALNLVTTTPDPPAGVLTPNEVFSRAGIRIPQQAPPPAAPVAPPPLAPAAATAPVAPTAPQAPPKAGEETVPNGIDEAASSLVPGGNVRVQKILAGGGKPPTADEAKDRLFAARGIMGTAYLDKMTGADVPSFWTNYVGDPQKEGIVSAFMQSNLPPDLRNFITARTAFTTAQLRKESGAAINSSEFRQSDTNFSPMPGDEQNPEGLAYKMEQRHGQIRELLKSAYANDPAGLQAAFNEAKGMGVDLTPHPERIPRPASARGPAPDDIAIPPVPSGAPEQMKALWGTMSPEARGRAIKNYGSQ